MMNKIKDTILPMISLFTSISTLLCCALPALLISLGMGAVMAGLVSNVPQLIWLSKHKLILFILAGIMLVVSWYFIYRKDQSCPVDLKKAKACMSLKRFNKMVFWISSYLYIIGIFFAYVVTLFI